MHRALSFLTIRVLFLASPLLLLPMSVQAQSFSRARLTHVTPPGAKAGTTVEVVIDGVNLDDVESLYFSQPGIKAERVPDPVPDTTIDPKTKKKPAPPPKVIRFKVSVPANTPVGTCDVRVATKLGITNPRAFAIGVLAEIAEKEPNNDVPQAQKVELNSTINGTISAKTDVDYYSFTGKKGQRIVFHCAGWSMDSKLSPMIQVYDEVGSLLTTKYRMVGDLVTDAYLPRDGEYFVRLCEFAYQYGGTDAFYRLSISEGPWLDTVFPPVVEAGKKTSVQIYGRNLPNSKPGPMTINDRPLDAAVIQVEAPPTPTEFVAYRGLLLAKTLGMEGAEFRVQSPIGPSNPVLLTYSKKPVTIEKPDNDSAEKAQEITIPAEICGRIEKRRDRDWFAFDANKDESISFEIFADRIGSPIDMVMQIWQPDPMKMLGEYDDHSDLPTKTGQFWTRTEDPKTTWKAPADGRYLLKVTSRTATMRAGPRFVYRVSVSRPRPDFHVVLIDNPDVNSGGFTVERGGSQEFQALCIREDGFSGEILLEATGLPKGVTCDPQVLGPDVSESVLVLRADANASLGFSEFGVKATATVAGNKIVRKAHSGTLVWPNAQKNQPAQSRLARSLCLSVRDPGPFTLDVSVREISAAVGSKNDIKIHTKRTFAEFKAPVAITRLAGPVTPGGKAIAVPNATIAAGKNEATIALQIPTNALPGSYSLVFQGKGKLSYQPNPKDKKKITLDFLTVAPPITVNVFNTVVDLAPTQPGIAIKPGENGAVAIKIKRLHKYDGPVQIELVPQSGAQGIAAKTATIPAGKNDVQLILQSPKNAKPAVYPNFLIRASAKVNNVVLKEEKKLQVSISNTVSADGVLFDVKTTPLLPESSADWRFLPLKDIKGSAWQTLTFDDKSWRSATSPIGYGEAEVSTRKGTPLTDMGQPVCFRHDLIVPAEMLKTKGVTCRLMVASDDNATVYLNGKLVDKDDADHEFSYWNRDIDIPTELLQPGRNVVAVVVNNTSGSSDLFFDLAVLAQTIAKKK